MRQHVKCCVLLPLELLGPPSVRLGDKKIPQFWSETAAKHRPQTRAARIDNKPFYKGFTKHNIIAIETNKNEDKTCLFDCV